jgi:hypothetical protein
MNPHQKKLACASAQRRRAKPPDHDCRAYDPQDGCQGCLEALIEKGELARDAYKETH